MSALTSGISATRELKRFFTEARDGQHSDVSVLRVHIRGEDLVETARAHGPSNGDLMQLSEFLDDRVGFLVLRASPATWYVVSWMPEDKVSVNNRMVYAASLPSLKLAVGEGCVEGTLQFTTREDALGSNSSAAQPAPIESQCDLPTATETAPAVVPKPAGLKSTRSFTTTKTTTTTTTLEYERMERRTEQRCSVPVVSTRPIGLTRPHADHRSSVPAIAPKPQAGVFVKKIDPRLAMSRSELEHVDLLQQEDDARTEQLEQMRTRLHGRTSVAHDDNQNAANQHANTAGIKQTTAAASGGFHSVTLPLAASATDALGGFAANVGTTVVELQIDAAKHVTSMRSFASTEEFAPNATEPRFYVMRTPGSRAFVYSCPEASAPRLRMVYSTATTSTLDQIQKLGCRITHRLQLFSSRECTLVAVAATIRNGQAQHVGDDKAIDVVVNYQPAVPARSLPSRFSAASTKPLDAFTDEGGFRKAFYNVRPDAPEPAPFRSPIQSRQSSFTDAVDSAPNSGAATWGVKLKSNTAGSMSHSVASSISNVSARTSTSSMNAKVNTSSLNVKTNTSNVANLSSRFSQTHLAGEAGDDSPKSGASDKSSPVTEFADVRGSQAPEIMRSSLPGLRPASGPRPGAAARNDKWNPWRPVNASNAAATHDDAAPESALQSSVYTNSGGAAPGSIADFMNDITYPPLQNTANRDSPEVK
ncbi:hypothetical protein IW142_005042 [Coemansia sp. RSA 564]|nr:hypothetical protein IW142_005042 [Coemansia sp. RSA 564]KAJ2184654.1 hypothetical protein EV181_004268 [Coemansia sp. RSA 532]KAJ2552959.1 hypothetical protein IWW35_002074 [Coemansia sp. RSA 1878]KAJ2589013.1 hypothetical protein IWW49_002700 [Coemansia sp. RSA 1797]